MSLRRSGGLLIAATLATFAPVGNLWAQDDPPPVGNLSARYKLIERFTTGENKPGYVGQYQVAFRESISASEPGGYSRTIQFSERPAAVPDDRRPSEIVRHYNSMQIKPEPAKKTGPKPLDDLTVWVREIPGKAPLVVSLTPNRGLLEEEYEFAVTNHYVSRLTFVLSADPVRIADSWRVSFAGTNALTNLPDLIDGSLTATLKEVKPHPSGVGQQAIITVTGRLEQDPEKSGDNETTINAELHFAFTPPASSGEGNVIEGYGAIEELRLTQIKTPKSLKKPWLKRELVLERRFPGKDPAIAIPDPPPTPTIENSWLTASAGKGEFYLRHAQDFDFEKARPTTGADDATGGRVLLIRPTPGNFMGDLITLDFYRATIQPNATFDELKAQWKAGKVEVTPSLARRLPEAEWPGMAVHYMEAVVKAPAQGPDQPVPRRYSYNYVIQFPRNVSIVATANTFSDKPEEFHKQAEAILRTIKLGPIPTP